MRWPWQSKPAPAMDWHDQFNRVSAELGTALRDRKEFQQLSVDAAYDIEELTLKNDRLVQAMKENEGASIAFASQISVLRSQLAAEQRSNTALRGVITRMKKTREKAVKEV